MTDGKKQAKADQTVISSAKTQIERKKISGKKSLEPQTATCSEFSRSKTLNGNEKLPGRLFKCFNLIFQPYFTYSKRVDSG